MSKSSPKEKSVLCLNKEGNNWINCRKSYVREEIEEQPLCETNIQRAVNTMVKKLQNMGIDLLEKKTKRMEYQNELQYYYQSTADYFICISLMKMKREGMFVRAGSARKLYKRQLNIFYQCLDAV